MTQLPPRPSDIERILELEKLLRQREQREEQLREALGHYHQLLETAPDVIYTLARDGSITSLNPAFEAVTGWTVDAWLGKPAAGLLHPDDASRMRRLLAGVLRGGSHLHVLRVRCRNGEHHTGEFTVRPLRDAKGLAGWFGIVRDITKRMRAEEALRLREAEYRRLFEDAPVGVFRSSVEGRPLMANPALVRMLGYSSLEELLNRDIEKEGYHSDTPRRAFRECLEEEGEVRGFEAKWLKKDGSVLHVRESARALRDGDGRVVGYEGTVEDISDYKNAIGALLESEERFRQVTEAALVGVYLVQGGKFRYVNPAFAEMFGYPAGEIEDRLSSVDLTHPEDRNLVAGKVGARLSRSEEVGRYTFRGLRRDGTAIHCEALSRFIEFNGRPAIMGTVMDITERKRAEDELRRTSERLQLQFDRMPIGCILWDAEFRVVSWNPAAERIFGFAFEEVRGTQPYDRIIPREVKPQIDGIWGRLLQGDDTAHSVNENLTRDGRTILCQWTNTPLREPDGRILGVLSMVEDITERRRAEAALQESVGTLRRTLSTTITTMAKIVETKDPYTAGHQIRVAELAELIAREMALPPDRVQGLHMAAMIHDIGKIYIPAEILSKPGQLTRIEIDMIRTHPNFGAEVLKAVPFPWPISEMILQHHERIDGSGYPRGLKGEDILLEARILMVADVVEAMATHRPYRAARGLIQALQEIQDFRGRYYDAAVVDACLRVIRQGLFSVESAGAQA